MNETTKEQHPTPQAQTTTTRCSLATTATTSTTRSIRRLATSNVSSSSSKQPTPDPFLHGGEHCLHSENLAFDMDVWYPPLAGFTFASVFFTLTRRDAEVIVAFSNTTRRHVERKTNNRNKNVRPNEIGLAMDHGSCHSSSSLGTENRPCVAKRSTSIILRASAGHASINRMKKLLIQWCWMTKTTTTACCNRTSKIVTFFYILYLMLSQANLLVKIQCRLANGFSRGLHLQCLAQVGRIQLLGIGLTSWQSSVIQQLGKLRQNIMLSL